MNYSYDDIYGLDLAEYLGRHGITLDELRERILIDIQILKERQIEVHSLKLPYPEDNIEHVVYKAIIKKQKHLNRLNDWANERED